MSASKPETALQKESRLFRELSARLRDALLSRIFDLRPEAAMRRSLYFFILFIISGMIILLIYHPLPEWTSRLSSVFSTVLVPSAPAEARDAAVSELIRFLLAALLDERILQYLPIFMAPFFIALQTAAIYLADVFELEDVAVARSFIYSVALSGSDETIRIRNGEIAEESKDSPAFLIGGPGKVVVELDSVALFERADGTPHVIGPTGKEPGGKATLEGFERFRHAIDVRDHYVDLRDQDDKSKAVKSRSRDGIPVKATDVRLMFSIFRGERPEMSAENPYPFSREAVENIAYKAASRVTPEKPNPSTFEFAWINNMIGLIRGRLGGFMSRHNLTEYMASIGLPEVEKARQREELIYRQMQQLTQGGEDTVERKEIKPPPDFQARYKVKDLFAQFVEEFTSRARNSGVELHWIGVGTWESPVKIVPETHLQAWLQTQVNLKNDSPEEMNRIEQAEVITKLKDLIKKVPLDAYEEIRLASRQTKRTVVQAPRRRERPHLELPEGDDNVFSAEEMKQFADMMSIIQTLQGDNKPERYEPLEGNHDHEVQALLLEYRKQFQETVDFIKNKGEPPPQVIVDAIFYIDNQIAHWAGRS